MKRGWPGAYLLLRKNIVCTYVLFWVQFQNQSIYTQYSMHRQWDPLRYSTRNIWPTQFHDIYRSHEMCRSFYSAIEQGQRFGMWVLRMAQFIWNWCSTNSQFRNDFWGLPFLDGVLKENPRLFSSWLDFFFYALGVDNHS